MEEENYLPYGYPNEYEPQCSNQIGDMRPHKDGLRGKPQSNRLGIYGMKMTKIHNAKLNGLPIPVGTRNGVSDGNKDNRIY